MSLLGRAGRVARGFAKELAERVLTGSGTTALARRYHRCSTVVLAYHNILPAGASPEGDRSLHLPRADFARQLDLLARTHRVVSFGKLIRSADPPAADSRPAAVLTFDDAYRGALTAGLEELISRDLPATFFVAPGRLGDRSFWWDQMAEAADGFTPQTRAYLLRQLGGRQDRIEAWMRRRGLEPAVLSKHARSVTERELTAVADIPGVTLGSHTWSHPHLPELARGGADQLEEELDASRRWLEAKFPESFRPWLAYPYGAVSDEAETAAAESGYRYGVIVGGGLCGSDAPVRRPRRLPRFNVPAGLSLRGFQLRTSGLTLG